MIEDGEGAGKAPPAARAAARVVAGWLLLTAPLLVTGGRDPVHLVVLALHLAGAGAILAADAGRARGAGGRIGRILLDWHPLVLVPLLYAELPLLMEGMPGPVVYHDAAVAALEQAVFRTQLAFTWAGAWPWTALSELLHGAYVSYYLLIYLPPLLLYAGVAGGPGEWRAAFHRTVLALALSFLLCFAVFVVLPVQGPRYLGVPAGVPDGPVRGLVLAILEGGSSRGAAFPSSHVSVAVTQALMALRHQRPLGRVVAVVAVGLAAGAVYGGFHYALDVLAGAAVGALAVPLSRALERAGTGRDPGFTSTPAAV